jgi:hypothetical protein
LQSPVRSWKFFGVIPEIDIWHAATLMLKRYGDRALEESVSRAKELASAGDDNGVAVWRRISYAVGQLINTTPPGPVHRRPTTPEAASPRSVTERRPGHCRFDMPGFWCKGRNGRGGMILDPRWTPTYRISHRSF